MTTLSEIYTLGSLIVAGVGVGVVGKRWGWFELVSGTNKLLREQNQELRNQNEFLKGQVKTLNIQHDKDKADWAFRHNESITEIAKLQGRVETLTAVPLQSIDKSLDALVKVSKDNAESNKLILGQLKEKAKIDAEDRDVLTNQNVHIRTEVHKVIDRDNKNKKKRK